MDLLPLALLLGCFCGTFAAEGEFQAAPSPSRPPPVPSGHLGASMRFGRTRRSSPFGARPTWRRGAAQRLGWWNQRVWEGPQRSSSPTPCPSHTVLDQAGFLGNLHQGAQDLFMCSEICLPLVSSPVTLGALRQSCEGRCNKGFDSLKKCQCDDLCLYYQSCCGDYASICKTKVTRGDVFLQPEDDYQDYYDVANATVGPPSTPEATGTPVDEQAWTEDYAWTEGLPGHTEETPWSPTDAPPLPGPEEGEESLCSGEPFDAFTSLKNGSIFAFRGLYLYELDEKSARPGYPKLIRDVWGIDGPIDAAFTRVNCQGKTYLFQGSRYWRFDEGRLDADYPRNISEGFEGVPDDLDAALALPAENYLGRERVYFFKGSRYWSYDFAHQPSRAECEQTSPSLVFDHYAVLQHDSWEAAFRLLFGASGAGQASRARFTPRDWHGLPSRLDAALLGRIYVAQSPARSPTGRRASRRRHRKKYQRRQRWGRWDSLPGWEPLLGGSSESSDRDWLLPPCQPFQSAYFFVDDKYYRVNLHTRRVDWAYPRYPRPIAKYWLGCPPEDLL